MRLVSVGRRAVTAIQAKARRDQTVQAKVLTLFSQQFCSTATRLNRMHGRYQPIITIGLRYFFQGSKSPQQFTLHQQIVISILILQLLSGQKSAELCEIATNNKARVFWKHL